MSSKLQWPLVLRAPPDLGNLLKNNIWLYRFGLFSNALVGASLASSLSLPYWWVYTTSEALSTVHHEVGLFYECYKISASGTGDNQKDCEHLAVQDDPLWHIMNSMLAGLVIGCITSICLMIAHTPSVKMMARTGSHMNMFFKVWCIGAIALITGTGLVAVASRRMSKVYYSSTSLSYCFYIAVGACVLSILEGLVLLRLRKRLASVNWLSAKAEHLYQNHSIPLNTFTSMSFNGDSPIEHPTTHDDTVRNPVKSQGTPFEPITIEIPSV